MSLFDLQDVCIAIGSLATLDLPMVVDLIGIYGGSHKYRIHDSQTENELNVLSMRRPSLSHSTTVGRRRAAVDRTCSDQFFEVIPSVENPSSLLVQIDGGRLNPVVDLIGGSTAAYRQEPDFPCEIWLEPGA
ncbi:hypothetical protein F511_29102 [Dorcoceras hygrometricum]|uniref:Uncharacterized protein n=1 Tax=Dorcoceras hygrometricum TaxID=472368 RepID=A0A2Z7A3V6_9LAMI|nr:hypothetical protein F511_29102 [Dorcoceras hygrometricum]